MYIIEKSKVSRRKMQKYNFQNMLQLYKQKWNLYYECMIFTPENILSVGTSYTMD